MPTKCSVATYFAIEMAVERNCDCKVINLYTYHMSMSMLTGETIAPHGSTY